MASAPRPALRPMRITATPDTGGERRGVPLMPEPAPARPMAPDRRSPTEDNGITAPRAELHIALIAPDKATADLLKGRVRVVKPPLWHGGKVYLHIILEDKMTKTRGIDMRVLQAMVDLGFVDASDVEIGPPDDMTIGYPS